MQELLLPQKDLVAKMLKNARKAQMAREDQARQLSLANLFRANLFRANLVRKNLAFTADNKYWLRRNNDIFKDTVKYIAADTDMITNVYYDESENIVKKMNAKLQKTNSLIDKSIRTFFIVRVDDNSMEPEYHEGDFVSVELKNTVSEGSVGLFEYDHKMHIRKMGDNTLIPLNQEYNEIVIEPNIEFVVWGEVIESFETEGEDSERRSTQLTPKK